MSCEEVFQSQHNNMDQIITDRLTESEGSIRQLSRPVALRNPDSVLYYHILVMFCHKTRPNAIVSSRLQIYSDSSRWVTIMT